MRLTLDYQSHKKRAHLRGLEGRMSKTGFRYDVK